MIIPKLVPESGALFRSANRGRAFSDVPVDLRNAAETSPELSALAFSPSGLDSALVGAAGASTFAGAGRTAAPSFAKACDAAPATRRRGRAIVVRIMTRSLRS